MGGDWFEPHIVYGRQIRIPSDTNYRKYINQVIPMKGVIDTPFSIYGILPNFNSRMFEYEEDTEMFDDMAFIVLGFTPDNDIAKNVEISQQLDEYIEESLLFLGFEFEPKSKFYSGIEWCPEIKDEDWTTYDDAVHSDSLSDADADADADAVEDADADTEDGVAYDSKKID
jgi:hypothetical protein